MKLRIILLSLALVVLTTGIVFAAPLKVSVSDFKVTGAANKEELKGVLPALLSARLGAEGITVVEPGEPADVIVKGNYIAFGKIFSIDARATSVSGKLIAKGAEQGESADDVIPAISRLAKTLGGQLGDTSAAVAPAAAAPVIATVVAAPVSDVVRAPQTLTKAVDGDIIRPAVAPVRDSASLRSPSRIEGTVISLAPLKRSSQGDELLAATASEIRLLRQESGGIKTLATLNSFKPNDKIIAIDSADLDGDGVSELYVTMLRGENLASQVYSIDNNSFKEIAVNLPYYFRVMSLNGGAKKVYAQQMGRDDDFFGDLYEVVKKGTSFSTVNPVKLPRFANIFNLSQIRDRSGKTLSVVINPDNYLIVYDEGRNQLWKSSDKFGGSEGYFNRDDSDNQRVTGSKFRKVFVEQRMFVTKEGDLIVPRNEGRFIGNSRTFSKSSVYALRWDEAGLNEVWRTKENQNYLVDYYYDDSVKTLITAEIVKREGISDKGATVIVTRKVE